MKRKSIMATAVAVVAIVFATVEVSARGGRGGGGARGGGGGYAGGGYRGGGYGGSPSMSRNYNRPNYSQQARPQQRPAPANRPSNVQRPATGNRPNTANRPADGNRPRDPTQRPNAGDVGDFLNLPADRSSGVGASRGGTKSWEKNGWEVTAGAGGKTGSKGGASGAVGGKGVKIETPGGKTVVKGSGGAAVKGPGGGAAAGKGSIGAAAGPGGVVAGGRGGAVASKGGKTIGRGGAFGVAAGAAGGVIAGGRGGGFAAGPGGAVARGGSWVGGRGPGGAAFAAGHFHSIRTNWSNWSCFHGGWWAAHPGCWHWPGFIAGVWTGLAWGAFTPWYGYADVAPIEYDYGDNVYYEDDQVYVDGEPAATPQEYYDVVQQQAEEGDAEPPSEDQDWLPLGVFALANKDETKSDKAFQLAINKQGVVRGNYFDNTNDTTQVVSGQLDRDSQRLAFTVGDDKSTVFECGIYNMTKDEVPVLVHYSATENQVMALVRLKQPADDPSNSKKTLNGQRPRR